MDSRDNIPPSPHKKTGPGPVIESLRENQKARVMGLSGSAPAFLAAKILLGLSRPVVLINPEEEEAEKCAMELRFYLRALGASAPAYRLAGRQAYGLLSAPAEQARSAALAAMAAAGPGSPVAVSTTLAGLMAVTTPPDLFSEHMTEIFTGSEIDRDEIIKSLAASGYTAVSQVMETGDFSVRGGIIDVFPPGQDLPVRAELWEEQLKSLRRFDPVSQKSSENIERVVLPPLKEVIVNPHTSGRALESVRELAQMIKEGKVPAPPGTDLVKSMSELIPRLELGEHFPGMETLLPAFYHEKAAALDYIDHSWVIIYHEPFLCSQALERMAIELDQEWARRLEQGEPAFPPDRHFISRERAEELMSPCGMVVAGLDRALEPAEGEGLESTPGKKGLVAPRAFVHDLEASPGISGDLGGLRIRPEAEEPLEPLILALHDFMGLGIRTVLVSAVPEKARHLGELLGGHGIEAPVVEDPAGVLAGDPGICITAAPIQRGFFDPAGRVAVVPEAEIFGEKIRPRRRRRAMESFIGDLSDLQEGDFVVHEDHGIGLYRGLKSLYVQWVGEWDFVNERQRPQIRMDGVRIEYAAGSTLYVPVHRLGQISKYRGPTEIPPPLDTLGGAAWERLKRKVKRSIREFAEYLIKIYAARQVNKGTSFPPPDATFRQFEESFEYEETPDQLRAIEEVLEDMERDRAMDRIVCGDVGYGKTEVALRAAFLGAMSGRQVAVLVPTTILAQQHHDTFHRRLQPYPIQVEVLSRFLSPREQKQVAAALEKGTADIVIGTHRLLSKDIRFRDLGLLIIDEEHRFGVKHKERMRELRATVDTLTLTATPIPRTLHMALSGLRELSIIDTPPPDRLAVHTELARSDDRIIREALDRELRRGGQAFYVHNRVQTIVTAGDRVRRLVPQARVAIAHGQMPERELETVMRDFVARRYDVLVCSAIIESGLDIPSVNTMIVDRADQFGLAQLYQLRGRIGRGRDRGYCYLLVPAKGVLTRDAAKRLRVLQEFTELGSGFKIAAHDLEIRGAGNLLGPEQSGHVNRVGLELYMRLLEEQINKLKGEAPAPEFEPEIKLPVPAYLPEEYMPDQNHRLSWYKRLSRARSKKEIESLREELVDRYGELPQTAENLLEVSAIKSALVEIRALELAYTGEEISLALAEDTRVDREKAIELATKKPAQYRLTPDNRINFRFATRDPAGLFPAIRGLLNDLGGGDTI